MQQFGSLSTTDYFTACLKTNQKLAITLLVSALGGSRQAVAASHSKISQVCKAPLISLPLICFAVDCLRTWKCLELQADDAGVFCDTCPIPQLWCNSDAEV